MKEIKSVNGETELQTPEATPMTITAIGREAYKTALEKGWYDAGTPSFPERIALCHAELSEALEAYRDGGNVGARVGVGGKPEGVPSELADVIIRIADMCHVLCIDLDEAIELKMAFNRTRPYRHGRKVI